MEVVELSRVNPSCWLSLVSGAGSHHCGHRWLVADGRNAAGVTGCDLAVQAIALSKSEIPSRSSHKEFFPLTCPNDTKLNECKNMNSKEMPRPNSIVAERGPALLISDLFPYQEGMDWTEITSVYHSTFPM